MVTMTDVAKHANVSKMTVSRVISGNGYVKEETREIVKQAIKELNYRPNLLAKGLASGHSRVLVYMLPDICDPFFGNVCKGITDVCSEQGYNSMLNNAPNFDSVDNLLNAAIDRQVDGVIFHHLIITPEQLKLLEDNGIKAVMIDGEDILEGAVNILNDDYQGAAMAMEYLVSQNYRRIACVRGSLGPEERPQDMSYVESFQKRIWQERTQGCLDTLKKHGMEPFGIYDGRASSSMECSFLSGQNIMREILAQPEWPDAIYCESDLLALGLLGELMEANVAVPETIALCGHDGLDVCRCVYPRITTVVQPRYEVGRQAAQVLINLIEGAEQQDIIMAPTLFIGDTTP